jgi:hypothetical protein
MREVSPMVKRFDPGLARLPTSVFFAMMTPENGAVMESFAAFQAAFWSRIEADPIDCSD